MTWAIDFDRWNNNSYPITTPQAPYLPSNYKVIGSKNLNNYAINYLQPWVDVLAGSFVDTLRDNNEKPEGADDHVEFAQFGAPFEQKEEVVDVEATIA